VQTFLLTWNPDKWPWSTFNRNYDRARKQGFLDYDWSSGRSQRLRRGDRVFLLRQGVEPRGILASGVVTSDRPYRAIHTTLSEVARRCTWMLASMSYFIRSANLYCRERGSMSRGSQQSTGILKLAA